MVMAWTWCHQVTSHTMIIWNNVDPDLCCEMMPLGHNELMHYLDKTATILQTLFCYRYVKWVTPDIFFQWGITNRNLWGLGPQWHAAGVWRTDSILIHWKFFFFMKQGSTLSFLTGCPKSHLLGWYRNFLVYSYSKLDIQVVISTCPKDKLGWIWRADDR